MLFDKLLDVNQISGCTQIRLWCIDRGDGAFEFSLHVGKVLLAKSAIDQFAAVPCIQDDLADGRCCLDVFLSFLSRPLCSLGLFLGFLHIEFFDPLLTQKPLEFNESNWSTGHDGLVVHSGFANKVLGWRSKRLVAKGASRQLFFHDLSKLVHDVPVGVVSLVVALSLLVIAEVLLVLILGTATFRFIVLLLIRLALKLVSRCRLENVTIAINHRSTLT